MLTAKKSSWMGREPGHRSVCAVFPTPMVISVTMAIGVGPKGTNRFGPRLGERCCFHNYNK